MGNKLESPSPKIKQIILEISETIEINSTFLKSEFNNLYELIGTDFKSNKQLQTVLQEILFEIENESILNLLQNLIDYIALNRIENNFYIQISYHVLKLILNALLEKNKNVHEIILFSLDKANIKVNSTIEKNIPFPFIIIKLCVEHYTEIDTEENEVDKYKFEILQLLTNILANFLNVSNNISITPKLFVEYIDPFKFFLTCNSIYCSQSDIINRFINKLILNFFICFNNFFIANKIENDKLLLENFEIILWFCLDLNKFFFPKNSGNFIDHFKQSSVNVKVREEEKGMQGLEIEISDNNALQEENEYYFENQFNEKIFKYLSYLFNIGYQSKRIDNYIFSPFDSIEKYSMEISKNISQAIISNQISFKDFIYNYFTNFDKLNQRFKECGKIFIIYLLECNQDISEMVCLHNLKLILHKLNFNDFYDLLILNKLTLCKNFYILLKSTSQIKTDSEPKLLQLSEKCLESILMNRKEILNLDSVSYLLAIIFNNMSCYLFEINSSILLKLGEFFTNFYDVELNNETFSENLIILDLILQTIFNLINNVEFPECSSIILMLLKFDEQLNTIHLKYDNFYKLSMVRDCWESYEFISKKLKVISNKFKNKISEEGANIKFTQNNELIKIINKTSIEKEASQNARRLKENKIFNTEHEKNIICCLYSSAEKNILKIINR